jgi:uncharacterized protein (DUF1800 family)
MRIEIMSTAREESKQPQEAWARWMREHEEVVKKATEPQRLLLEAAVRFVAAVSAQPLLLRLAAFFLLHAGSVSKSCVLVEVASRPFERVRARHRAPQAS